MHININGNDCSSLPTSASIIIWKAKGAITTNGSYSSSSFTDIDVNFSETYRVVNGKVKVFVTKIEGEGEILVDIDGYYNMDSYLTSSATESQTAINDMMSYYSDGYRNLYHSLSASLAHEEYHYEEWQCANELFLGDFLVCVQNIEVDVSTSASLSNANSGAFFKFQYALDEYYNKVRDFFFILGDGSGDPPYAVGQSVLNTTISSELSRSIAMGWSVTGGITPITVDPPCTKSNPFVYNCPN